MGTSCLQTPHPPFQTASKARIPIPKDSEKSALSKPLGFYNSKSRNRIITSCSVLWFLRGQACTHKQATHHIVPTTKDFTAPSPTSPSSPQTTERPGLLPYNPSLVNTFSSHPCPSPVGLLPWKGEQGAHKQKTNKEGETECSPGHRKR